MTQSLDSATPASLAGLRAGADVGGYRLVRRLGAGGMGVVWEAVDADGDRVAMKILHPQIAADPTARRRLDREASVLARVKDTRVARILDIETGDGADGTGVTFVITELVDGPALQHEVDHEGVYSLDTDIRDLSDLAHGLVDALAAVHAAGVIHRDLKPSNVMLGPQGPILIDFGIAQVADDVRLTQTGQVTGTPGFIPPEMLDGGEPSPGVDWYACAGVLLFTITGRSPFGSGPWQAVFRRVYAGTPELGDLEETQPALARAFTAALAPEASDRLPVPDLLRVLDEIADGGSGQVALAEVLPDTTADAPELAVDEADTSTGTYGSIYPPGRDNASNAAYGPGYGRVASTPSPPGAYGFLSTPPPQAGDARPMPPGGPATGSMPPFVPPSESVLARNDATPPHSFAPGDGQTPMQATPAPTPATFGAPGGSSGPVPQTSATFSTAVAPQPAPAPQGGVPDWALEPRRHRTVAAVFFLMLAALALPVPGWVMILFTLLVVVAGTVGRAEDARRWRRLRAGRASAADTSRMWASMPWYLLRSLVAGAAACIIGAVVGWLIYLLGGTALGFGNGDATGADATVLASWSAYHRMGSLLALVASAYMFIAWFVPWGAPTRRGGAHLIGMVLRSRSSRLIGGAVFVAVALGVVVLFAIGAIPVARIGPFSMLFT
ncbi:serine/threonine-protein kinase [Actinomyces sp.]|uniref:serine/threonine-protein kinase n=1 Tax=Actinomyces sp. TaxID=29317 RepID=UPI0026DD608E|nr:serine/threonine protein kinase [Actinomyces sp.]MDO4901184.1 protein kinase [Actinomyces sp.]